MGLDAVCGCCVTGNAPEETACRSRQRQDGSGTWSFPPQRARSSFPRWSYAHQTLTHPATAIDAHHSVRQSAESVAPGDQITKADSHERDQTTRVFCWCRCPSYRRPRYWCRCRGSIGCITEYWLSDNCECFCRQLQRDIGNPHSHDHGGVFRYGAGSQPERSIMRRTGLRSEICGSMT